MCREAPLICELGLNAGSIMAVERVAAVSVVAQLLAMLDAVCGNMDAASLGVEYEMSLCGELKGLYVAPNWSEVFGPLLPKSPPQRDIPCVISSTPVSET